MRTFGVPAALQTNSTKLKVKNCHKYNFMNGKSRLLDQTAQFPFGYHLISNNSKTPPLQTINHLKKKIASPQLKLNLKILEKNPTYFHASRKTDAASGEVMTIQSNAVSCNNKTKEKMKRKSIKTLLYEQQ